MTRAHPYRNTKVSVQATIEHVYTLLDKHECPGGVMYQSPRFTRIGRGVGGRTSSTDAVLTVEFDVPSVERQVARIRVAVPATVAGRLGHRRRLRGADQAAGPGLRPRALLHRQIHPGGDPVRDEPRPRRALPVPLVHPTTRRCRTSPTTTSTNACSARTSCCCPPRRRPPTPTPPTSGRAQPVAPAQLFEAWPMTHSTHPPIDFVYGWTIMPGRGHARERRSVATASTSQVRPQHLGCVRICYTSRRPRREHLTRRRRPTSAKAIAGRHRVRAAGPAVSHVGGGPSSGSRALLGDLRRSGRNECCDLPAPHVPSTQRSARSRTSLE